MMRAIFYPDGFKREFLAVDRVQWYDAMIEVHGERNGSDRLLACFPCDTPFIVY